MAAGTLKDTLTEHQRHDDGDDNPDEIHGEDHQPLVSCKKGTGQEHEDGEPGAVEEGILGGAIAAQLGWTPLIAFAFMVFCLLYVPCVASLGTIRGETNSWRWTGFAAVYTTGVAWIAATLIFQIGRLFIA